MSSQGTRKSLKQIFIDYGLLFDGDTDVEKDLMSAVRDWILLKRELPQITICLEDYKMGRNNLIDELLQDLEV